MPERETSSSGYPGVYWNKRKKVWEAQIKDQGKTIFVGKFDSAEEARRELEKAQSSRSASSHPVNITGVTWHKLSNKWVAKYSLHGHIINVGSFTTREEAKQALDEDRRRRNLPAIGTSKHSPRQKKSAE